MGDKGDVQALRLCQIQPCQMRQLAIAFGEILRNAPQIVSTRQKETRVKAAWAAFGGDGTKKEINLSWVGWAKAEPCFFVQLAKGCVDQSLG